MMKEAISHYLKGGYTVLAISVLFPNLSYSQTCLKLIRFYLTLIQYIFKYQYTQLALDILGVTEEELTSIEHPSQFVIHYLRMCCLQSLSQCDEIMILQNSVYVISPCFNQDLLIPLLQCIGICEELGLKRKMHYFIDRVNEYETV